MSAFVVSANGDHDNSLGTCILKLESGDNSLALVELNNLIILSLIVFLVSSICCFILGFSDAESGDCINGIILNIIKD